MKIDAGIKWLADGYRHKLFEDESLKQAAIQPSDKDNFILHPKDDPKTFVEYNIGGQSNEKPQRLKPSHYRIHSASSVRLQDRPWRQQTPVKYPAGFTPRSRPASAMNPKTRSSAAPTPRLIKSAGSVRTAAEVRAQETLDQLRKGFTLVNKLYENNYNSTSVRLHPASPAPDYRYFDRHCRCFDHTHAHRRPYSDRPQPACEKFLEACGSRAVSPARLDDPNVQPQRYIDYHRPRTAPGTRRELQYIPRPSYVYRDRTPHFCNFVHQISLHKRSTTEVDSLGVPDSELGEETDFILESAEGRLVSKYRRTSSSSSKDSQGMTQTPRLEDYAIEPDQDSIPEIKEDLPMTSGTEGRPGSPSSLDGDSRQEENGTQQPVTEVRVTSPIKPDHVKSPLPSPGDKKSKPRTGPRSPKSEDRMSSRTNMSIPEETEDKLDADGRSSAWGGSSELARGSKNKSVGGHSSSDSENRVPSPVEPPPSPEPLKQQKLQSEIPLPVTTTTSKKRGCASKKTKKPVERVRKKREMELPSTKPEPLRVEAKSPEPASVLESDKVDAKVDVKVPELPGGADKQETPKKTKSKAKRHLIEVEDDLFKPDPSDLLNDQMKQNRADFDWSNMDTNGAEELKRQPQIKSWIQGRLALSQQSSRFELPMDMKELETMTPQEYIKKHCIITSRRANLYQKIFLKNKDKSLTILYKDLDRSLKDVLVNTITSDQVQEILHMLNVDENTKVDYKLFAGIAAFAERVLYPQFVTEDTHDMPEYQREKIECADFCALPWKLHGVNVNPDMRKLLEQIR